MVVRSVCIHSFPLQAKYCCCKFVYNPTDTHHQVIHPLTMEQIRNVHVPLRLKNVNNPTGAGTIIYPSTTPSSSPYSIPRTPKSHSGTSTPLSTFMTANGYHGDTQHRRTPTAVTVKDSIIVINVLSHRNIKSYGFLAQIFERLDHHKIVVDLITTSEKSISLAVSSADDTLAIKRVTAEIEKLGTVRLQHKCRRSRRLD